MIEDDVGMDAKATSLLSSLFLQPGACGSILEAEWFHFLETAEPLHQWANVFLIDEGPPDGCVRAYVRDDSPRKQHLCSRLDLPNSARARRAVDEIEAASRELADLITLHQAQPSMSPADMGAEKAASEAFTALADRTYAELLGG